MDSGELGEIGFEWPYVASTAYKHDAIVRNVIARGIEDRASFPTYVTNTHQDQDYADPEHPASVNLRTIFRTLRETATEFWDKLDGPYDRRDVRSGSCRRTRVLRRFHNRDLIITRGTTDNDPRTHSSLRRPPAFTGYV